MVYMNNYNIITTEQFELELQNIIKYISSSLQEPITAQKIGRKIRRKISSLNFLPERYIQIANAKFKDGNTRKLILDNYIIIYTIDDTNRQRACYTYLSWKTKLSRKSLIIIFKI